MATTAAQTVSDAKRNPLSATAVETAGEGALPSTFRLLSSYLGVSFAVFLGFLPRASLSYLPSLQSRNRILALKLFQAEDQLRQLRSRRREDAKANARVAEIFAGHRHAWHQEERRLVHQLSAADNDIATLKARIADLEKTEADLRSFVKKLEKEVSERDEMLDFMARKAEGGGNFTEKEKDLSLEEEELCADFSAMGGKFRFSEEGLDPVVPDGSFSERNSELDEMVALYARQNGLGRDFFPPPAAAPAWKPWTDRSAGWENDCLDSMYHMKPFVPRRESPWKVDGESAGVSSKLKLLEQELINLEKVGKGDLSTISSLMRKQAKRYQSLAGKIDDLCRRMQVSDPCDPNLSPEFRTQRQTEFLLEAFHLQNRATEIRHKLSTLQTETTKSNFGDELTAQAKLSTRRSLDLVRNNFKEIQRNLEIWLARIMGDLEGILARDSASRVRDYHVSPYPFVR
ncbi:uncharacterized protein LOC103703811 [Phoenix dactylifera]|uniref:Uncharacterized protein LOC103703811 n=1 Tax=Phoenix dactylifera TaxID=42345 RepID=A0A8B7BTH3_PHODC|nr:uncharacterized protein LOC103703811 [Phoenix dactylifera]XP_008785031.1 uncharacterized protein LOC103703811 [Phoenix dactylifera]XP_017697457.1 uncharacterized protein LOC103703811 [Phoenix dactylifera]